MNDRCRFCAMMEEKGTKAVEDTVLYEDESFFIVPALGCLVKNYIMIVSKRHVLSMCCLDDREQADLTALLNKIRVMMKDRYGFYPLVFEHGAAEGSENKGACCVLHAHLHIVPYRIGRQAEMIDSLELEQRDGFVDFFSSGQGNPYIFFMDNVGMLYHRNLTDAVLPSQVIRKWIAADIGRPSEWDWKYHPFRKNIEDTVDELKPLIRRNICGDYRLKYVYYCRAMDGLDVDEIESEYGYVRSRLVEQGRVLVNPFEKNEHRMLAMNRLNAELIVKDNLRGISCADCVVVNLSIQNHAYVGCIAEMVYAKQKGCYVIVVAGDTGVEKHFHTIYHADRIVHDLEELFRTVNWRV